MTTEVAMATSPTAHLVVYAICDKNQIEGARGAHGLYSGGGAPGTAPASVRKYILY